MTVTSDASSREPSGSPRGVGPNRSIDGAARPWLAIAVGAAVVIGVAARFVATSDLWLDEALSVNIATLHWGDIPDALRRDGAPPLYYALLHVWTDLFGTSDAAVRALSAVFGVATLPLALAAGRRIGGNTVGWSAVVLLALNPFALRYATEARMYSLLAFLVLAGLLAFRRAYERPSGLRLALLALAVAALLYTHYWAFYVVAASGLVVLWLAWRGASPRAARRMLGAYLVGGLAFLPWLPIFLHQAEHTGTPWGTPVLPGIPIGTSLLAFAGGYEQEGWALVVPFVAVVLVGVFGRVADDRSITVDFVPQKEIRGEAFVGFAALVLGATAAWLVGSAFQTRYATIVLPLVVLAGGRGAAQFRDVRVRAGVLAFVSVLSLVGVARNATEQRTQVGEVADALAELAEPGDVVVVCPDQLGPALARVAPDSLDIVTYPNLAPPEFVNWEDYEAVLADTDPAAVAEAVRARADDAAVFMVSAPGYATHEGTCEALGAAIAAPDRSALQIVAPDVDRFELAGLVAYLP